MDLAGARPSEAAVAVPWLREVTDADPACAHALALLTSACHPAVAHHGARTLRYALHLAEHEQAPVDRAALVCAALLHDVGASPLASSGPSALRFEVAGADLAVALLAEHDWAPARRAAVWAAVAVHTSPHIGEAMSPLTRLVRLGVRADFGEDLLDPALRSEVEAVHPRLEVERVLSGVVVALAEEDGRRAPSGSWAAALLAAHRGGDGPDARLAGF